MTSVEELVTKLTRPQEILIVEDDAPVADSMRDILTRHFSCNVTLSSTGEDALERLSRCKFDLILLDLLLPTLSSLEVLKSVKAKHPFLPVVLVTGWPGSPQAEEAARLGAVGLVVKPFSPADFEEVFRLFKIRAVKVSPEHRNRPILGSG